MEDMRNASEDVQPTQWQNENEHWQQAGAAEDEEMDERRFEIYSAHDRNDIMASGTDDEDDDDIDDDEDDDDDDDDDAGSEDWGDVDPQPSGRSGMDPSGPGSAV